MTRPWFDHDTGVLLFDEYVTQMPSFQRIFEDGIVTAEELESHTQRTIELLRQLESLLSNEAKELATDVFSELTVLYAIQRHLQLQR